MDETGSGDPEQNTGKIEHKKPSLKVVSLTPKKDVPILAKVRELIDEAAQSTEGLATQVAVVILSGPEHLYVRPVSVGPISSVAIIGLLEVSKHVLMQNNIEFE